VARIPHGEVLSYDCTHFEPYLDPQFDTIVSDQIDFLDRHVGANRVLPARCDANSFNRQ
jgi:hypothetical protein